MIQDPSQKGWEGFPSISVGECEMLPMLEIRKIQDKRGKELFCCLWKWPEMDLLYIKAEKEHVSEKVKLVAFDPE